MLHNDYTFNVFPNPGNDISIETKGNDLSALEIIDLQGDIIQQIDIDTNIEIYKVNELKAGLYFVRLMRGGEVLEQRKVVISE